MHSLSPRAERCSENKICIIAAFCIISACILTCSLPLCGCLQGLGFQRPAGSCSGVGTVAHVSLLSLRSLVGLSGDAPCSAGSSLCPQPLGASPTAQGLVLWGGPTAIHVRVPTEAGACLQGECGRLRVTEGASSGADRVGPLLLCARCAPCLSRPGTSGLTAQHPQGPEAECRGDSPCRLQTVTCGRDLTLCAAVCSSITWGQQRPYPT